MKRPPGRSKHLENASSTTPIQKFTQFFTLHHLKHHNKPLIICGPTTESAPTTKLFGWLGAILAITRVIFIITLGITKSYHLDNRIVAGLWAELVFLMSLYACFVSLVVYSWGLESRRTITKNIFYSRNNSTDSKKRANPHKSFRNNSSPKTNQHTVWKSRKNPFGNSKQGSEIRRTCFDSGKRWKSGAFFRKN